MTAVGMRLESEPVPSAHTGSARQAGPHQTCQSCSDGAEGLVGLGNGCAPKGSGGCTAPRAVGTALEFREAVGLCRAAWSWELDTVILWVLSHSRQSMILAPGSLSRQQRVSGGG